MSNARFDKDLEPGKRTTPPTLAIGATIFDSTAAQSGDAALRRVDGARKAAACAASSAAAHSRRRIVLSMVRVRNRYAARRVASHKD